MRINGATEAFFFGGSSRRSPAARTLQSSATTAAALRGTEAESPGAQQDVVVFGVGAIVAGSRAHQIHHNIEYNLLTYSNSLCTTNPLSLSPPHHTLLTLYMHVSVCMYMRNQSVQKTRAR